MSVKASIAFASLLLIMLAIAIIVFVAGDRVSVLLLSTAAGLGCAGLGVWNYFRAVDFERANPGSVEISGGGTSIVFVLLALAVSAWSMGAIGLIRRHSRR